MLNHHLKKHNNYHLKFNSSLYPRIKWIFIHSFHQWLKNRITTLEVKKRQLLVTSERSKIITCKKEINLTKLRKMKRLRRSPTMMSMIVKLLIIARSYRNKIEVNRNNWIRISKIVLDQAKWVMMKMRRTCLNCHNSWQKGTRLKTALNHINTLENKAKI